MWKGRKECGKKVGGYEVTIGETKGYIEREGEMEGKRRGDTRREEYWQEGGRAVEGNGGKESATGWWRERESESV